MRIALLVAVTIVARFILVHRFGLSSFWPLAMHVFEEGFADKIDKEVVVSAIFWEYMQLQRRLGKVNSVVFLSLNVYSLFSILVVEAATDKENSSSNEPPQAFPFARFQSPFSLSCLQSKCSCFLGTD